MLGLRSSSWHGFERKAQYLGPIVTAGMSFKSGRCFSDIGVVTTFHKEMDFDRTCFVVLLV